MLKYLLSAASAFVLLFSELHAQGSAYFPANTGLNTRIRVSDASPTNGSANPNAYKISGSSITVEAWVYLTDLPDVGKWSIICARPATNGFYVNPYWTYRLAISDWDGNGPRFSAFISDGVTASGGGQDLFVPDPAVAVKNVWYHVAMTYDGSMLKLYINGDSVNSGADNISIGTGSTGFYTGGGSNESLEGLMDELRLWNITRTQAEIQSTMNSTLAGNESGLAGYWKFDEAAGATIAVDATINHNDLLVQNGATFVTSSFGQTVHFATFKYFRTGPGVVYGNSSTGGASIVGLSTTVSVKASGEPPVTSLNLIGPAGSTFTSVSADSGYITWTPTADQSDQWQLVTMSATSSAGTISQPYYIYTTFAHTTGSIIAGVRNDGKIGSNQDQGAGFYLDGKYGLFEGSLLLGTSNSQVSGTLYQPDFRKMSSVTDVSAQWPGFDKAFYSEYSDSNALLSSYPSNPLGVKIKERSFSRNSAPDNDYVIMDYEIVNTTGNAIDSLYVGVAMDWDIGNSGTNLAAYDDARKLGYMYDSTTTINTNYYGVALLNRNVTGMSIYNNTTNSETDTLNFQRLTTIQTPEPLAKDKRVTLGAGPLRLAPGSSQKVQFAVVAGTNQSDLQANTDAAINAGFSLLRLQDSLALVDLYNSTNGANWTNKTYWLPVNPINTWYGVTVTNGRVTSLILENNNLSGTLPLSLGQLTELNWLSLFHNNITGTIPFEIGNLTKMVNLILGENQLNGTLPASIGSLTQLAYLNLSTNQLSGSLPSEIGNLTDLWFFAFDRNQLTGYIPNEIGNLVALQYIYGYSNQLSGSLPSSIGNLVALKELHLYNNLLSGPIPPEIGSMSSLQYLYLYANQLTGNLPAEIGNLSSLLQLSLSYNQLSGDLPATLTGLVNLNFLRLDHNQFTGSIPSDIGNLTNLTWLYFWNNQMSGTLPPSLGNLVNLQRLSVSNNNFTGTLPDLGNLNNLQFLFLDSNQLSGTVPSSWSNLTNLQLLWLQDNQLSGSLPAAFLPNLKWVNVSSNNFSGLGQITAPKLKLLNLRHNQFGDSIPNAFAGLDSLEALYLDYNRFTFVPNLSGLQLLDTLTLSNNRLTFESIEPNLGGPDSLFTYSPQDSLGEVTARTAMPGLPITLRVAVGGSANSYQWMKDGVDIGGATNDTFVIASYDVGRAGSYVCRITNSNVPDLTLFSQPFNISTAANLTSGSAYFPSQTSNARVRVADGVPNNVSANEAAYKNLGTQMTVEAWVYPMSLPGTNSHFTIVSRPTTNGADPFAQYQLSIANYDGGYGYPAFEFKVSSGNPGDIVYASSPEIIQAGQWYHIAGTYDGSLAKIYINGVLKGQAPFSQNIGTVGPGFYIGGTFNGTPNRFHGLINDVRLWNVARTASEIETAMLGTVDAASTGLVGNWWLDESPGSLLAIDRTANHNDLNAQNGTAFTAGIIPGSAVSIAPTANNVIATDGAAGHVLKFTVLKTGYPASSLSIFSAPSGVSLDADTVVWTPTTGQTQKQTIVVQQTNGAGTADITYTAWIDTFAVTSSDHNNNNITLSVLNNGAIGGVTGNASGMQIGGHRGLFEADVVIAKSDTQVSGKLFTPREFATRSGVTSFTSDLSGFDQALESSFDDHRADYPVGVLVKQRTYSKSSAPDQNYVIMNYEITNTSGQDLQNIYVGLVADWDIGNAGANLGAYDSTRRLSYFYENGGAIDPNYYGIVSLTGHVSGHAFFVNGTDGDEPELYQRLTTQGADASTPADQRAVVGTGPFNIKAGSTIHAAYAFAAGNDLASLQSAADAALAVPLNRAPVITSAFAQDSVSEDAALTFITTLSDHFYDMEGQTFSTLISSAPSNGFAILRNDSLYYSPAADYFGNDQIGITTSDGSQSVQTVVPLFIESVNDAPKRITAVPDTSLPEDFGSAIVRRLSFYFNDVDNGALNYNAASLSAGVAAQTAGDSVIVSSAANFNGTVLVAVSASDGQFTALDTFALSVLGVNDPALLTAAFNDTTLGQNFGKARVGILSSHFADIDNGALTYKDSSLSAGINSQISNDTLYVLSQIGFTGIVNVRIQASDGEFSIADTFTVSVIDSIKPVLFYGVLASELVDKVRIVAGANEPLSQINVTVNSQSLSMTKQGDAYFATLPLSTGSLALNITARDAANNQSTGGRSYTVSLLNKPSAAGNYSIAAKPAQGYLIASTAATEYPKELISVGECLELVATQQSGELTVSYRYNEKLTALSGLSKFHEGKIGFYERVDDQWGYIGGQGKAGTVTAKVTGNNPVAVFYNSSHNVIPDEFALGSNYPNPFNPTTTLRFDLPEASRITLKIYNILGQEVRTLISGEKPAGMYEILWDGKDALGRAVSSGAYLYRIQAGKFTKTRKMLLVK